MSVRDGADRGIGKGLLRPGHALASAVTIAGELDLIDRNLEKRHVAEFTM